MCSIKKTKNKAKTSILVISVNNNNIITISRNKVKKGKNAKKG
jgi:hypothetical protein